LIRRSNGTIVPAQFEPTQPTPTCHRRLIFPDFSSSRPAHTQHHPVFVPGQGHHPPQSGPGLTAAAQIAAQYDPARNNQQQQNQAAQEPQLSVRITLQPITYVRINFQQANGIRKCALL